MHSCALQFTLKSQLFTLHPAVYAASNHARWLACGLMMAISLGFDRIATPDNYQRLVFIAVAVPIIIDTFPLLSFGAQSASEERDLATPSFSSWLQDPVRTARACYWHATITDVCSTPDSNLHTANATQEQPRTPRAVVSLPGQRLTHFVLLSCFCSLV